VLRSFGFAAWSTESAEPLVDDHVDAARARLTQCDASLRNPRVYDENVHVFTRARRMFSAPHCHVWSASNVHRCVTVIEGKLLMLNTIELSRNENSRCSKVWSHAQKCKTVVRSEFPMFKKHVNVAFLVYGTSKDLPSIRGDPSSGKKILFFIVFDITQNIRIFRRSFSEKWPVWPLQQGCSNLCNCRKRP
jgi:hypothetical protein